MIKTDDRLVAIEKINEIIEECSFHINTFVKDLRKLNEDGFRNIFTIALIMRLNRSPNENIFIVNNEALSRNGKTDISIRLFGDYQFLYIIEVKIYNSFSTIKNVLRQVTGYIQRENKYISIIIINKEKNFSEFEKVSNKIDSYFEKLENEKITTNVTKKESSSFWQFDYFYFPNVEFKTFFYYVDFYGKKMNKPHIKTGFIIKRKEITKQEFKNKIKYIIDLKKNEIPIDNINKKENLLYKISKNQQASLEYTKKNIKKLEGEANLNKDLKEFLKQHKEIILEDERIWEETNQLIKKYLKILYIIKE